MSQKILVVDDDPTTVRLVAKTLSSRYEVESAEDGLDALVKIKQIKPDLVVLDIMMPEINGYDVCYQLRFNDEYEKIPIVIVTSRPQELAEVVGEMAGIEYVHKPIDTQLLLEKVALLLGEES